MGFLDITTVPCGRVVTIELRAGTEIAGSAARPEATGTVADPNIEKHMGTTCDKPDKVLST